MSEYFDPNHIHGLSRDIATFLAERGEDFPSSVVALAYVLCMVSVEMNAPKDELLKSVGQTYDIIKRRTETETMQ